MRALTISADDFEDSELTEPVAALRQAGVDVDIASLGAGVITGKQGTRVETTLNATDADAGDYDMLFLPGGKAPAQLRQDESVLALARSFMDADRLVAAICHGPQVLISADRVKGRRMTSYASVASELKAAGADYRDEEVVIDRNLITSREPKDIPAFIEQILRALGVGAAAS